MVLKHKLAWSLGVLALSVMAGTRMEASSLSDTFTGTLTSESGSTGSVVLESFSLTAPSEVTIYTTSYGGGMNLNGSTTGPGGFQPNITLYDGTGFVVANQSPSFSPIANADPSNGWKGDGYLQDTDAPAGTYYVTLTDWQNQLGVTATGLNLSTSAYTQFTGPGGSSFQDVQGNTRTGNYALDISAMPLGTSSVPEPATALLVVPAFAALALILRKRRSLVS
jgi:hypothetical protein